MAAVLWPPGRPFDLGVSVRCVEPRKRLVAGRFGWAFHRFPIRGGITPLQAMQQDACEPSFLIRLLKGVKP